MNLVSLTDACIKTLADKAELSYTVGKWIIPCYGSCDDGMVWSSWRRYAVFGAGFYIKFDKSIEEVYEVVKSWAVERNGWEGREIYRPFYPGGDYRHFEYGEGVVIDNPPFSILAEIVDFYNRQGIEYFLFCPGLKASGRLRHISVLDTA